jgi:transposase
VPTVSRGAIQQRAEEFSAVVVGDFSVVVINQAILMANRGRRSHEIAEDLGVSERTIQRWLNRYRRGSKEGLKPAWRGVKKGLIPQTLAPEIIEWVRTGPSGCGLERANWTFFELAVHLYRTHGIKVSETTMREFCHRHDIRPYRPTYLYLKADPEEQERARQKLAGLKKRGPRRSSGAPQPG